MKFVLAVNKITWSGEDVCISTAFQYIEDGRPFIYDTIEQARLNAARLIKKEPGIYVLPID